MRKFTLPIWVVLFCTAFSGCEVFVDFGLKNTTLEVYDARIPGNELELMTLMVNGYQMDNPSYRYIVHFYDGDRVTGTYFAADTVKYEVEGTWSLPEADILRIDLDSFVDGDFLITKLDKNTFLLKTESNALGLPIQPETTPLDMYIRKVH